MHKTASSPRSTYHMLMYHKNLFFLFFFITLLNNNSVAHADHGFFFFLSFTTHKKKRLYYFQVLVIIPGFTPIWSRNDPAALSVGNPAHCSVMACQESPSRRSDSIAYFLLLMLIAMEKVLHSNRGQQNGKRMETQAGSGMRWFLVAQSENPLCRKAFVVIVKTCDMNLHITCVKLSESTFI